jgi:RNA polymerase sigma-70 factor (ECF subfamily)
VELSDWQLVEKCQAGDADAFQELVSRYHQKVFMVILGLMRNREDALEVAQETFFRAYRKIKSFQGGSSFYTWIYRIAVNNAIDANASRTQPVGFSENHGWFFEARNEVARILSDVRDRELRETVAINELTPEHKAVIVLRTIEGMS